MNDTIEYALRMLADSYTPGTHCADVRTGIWIDHAKRARAMLDAVDAQRAIDEEPE